MILAMTEFFVTMSTLCGVKMFWKYIDSAKQIICYILWEDLIRKHLKFVHDRTQ